MNDEKIESKNLKFLLQGKEQEFYEFSKSDSSFNAIYAASAAKSVSLAAANKVRIYPISFDFIGIEYFFLVFYQSKNINNSSSKLILFIKRQLFLVLYLRELSLRFKENQEFLDGAFQKNPISMCLTDAEGVIIKFNKEFQKLFPHQFQNIKKILPIEFIEQVMTGSSLEKEFFYEKKNLKIRGIPLYAIDGVIRGGLYTIIDDSIQYLLFKKLEASEERYKKLLNELPVGLAILNELGYIYFVNYRFTTSLGFLNAEKIQGNSIHEFFEIPSNFEDIIKEVQENKSLYLQLSLKEKYGENIFSIHLQKIYLGEEEFIEAVFQDITVENTLYRQLEQKNKLIEEELYTARLIWEHLLSIPPIYSSSIRFETFFKPSAQLGGDFYDVIQIDEIHIGVLIADVSGHGVSSSLITAMLKMLVEFAPRDPHRLDGMVSYLNTIMMKVLPEDQYITLFYGIIDTKNYTMEYINCGHPFPLVFDEKKKSIQILDTCSFPLGTKRNVPYSDFMRKTTLPPSCKILLYTDGLFTFKKEEGLVKIETVIEVFKQSTGLQNKHILNYIYQSISENSFQFTDDDVSMLLVILSKQKILKNNLSIPSNVLEIDNAIVKIMEDISLFIQISEELKWRLYTSLYEAIINSVEHGNKFNVQKRVSISYRIFRDYLIFKVGDEGTGFRMEEIPDPLQENNLLKPSGRGVYMIRKIMDRVKYNKKGNEVTLALHYK
jgi:sigma-B regulation protein RsbU (phosphoserine phosphatase)